MYKFNVEIVKSDLSTIFDTIRYYPTIKGVKCGQEFIVRKDTNMVLETCIWMNGVKEDWEFEYQYDNKLRRSTFYTKGKKNGCETFIFDNDKIQAIDQWLDDILLHRTLFSYTGEKIEEIDYRTRKGIHYYDDGYTPSSKFNFGEGIDYVLSEKYYNKDGTEMSSDQEYEFLGYTRCHICDKFECEH